MNDQMIICPECNAEIPLNIALTEKMEHQMEEKMKLKLKAAREESEKKEKLMMAEIEKKEKEIQFELAKKEMEFKAKEEDFKRKEADQQKKIEEGIEKEREKIALEASKKAAKQVELQMKDLEIANKEKEDELKSMKEAELELRKQKREIEAREKNLALEMERKLDENRAKIAEEAKKEAIEEARLKIAEKDKQMEQLKKSLEDAKRKSEQGSMQIQGDVQENDLKILLESVFPVDNIADVPTGINGADLIQTVHTKFGQEAGIILWESKNTKAWSNNWIKKLKDDQAAAKADVCILISQVLPEGISDFGYVDGVWVCSYPSASSLASVLRTNILQVSKIKQSLVGKDQKMEMLYNYLSGNEFKNKMENIVSAFSGLKIELDKEKRAMQRIWSRREKEIDRVQMNTSGMYGDLQGIIGASSLQTIDALELPEGENENE